MTNKELNQKAYSYILGCIDSEGYNVLTETETQKLQFLYKTFKSEYCYPANLKYYGSEHKTFENWIMGLPSCFNVEFVNYEILNLYKKWYNIAEMTEKQEDKILGNYWNFITIKTFQLFKKFKINQI